MNPQHLRTLVWLRYRLRVNQLKRGGIANQVILAILGGAVVVAAVGLFVTGLLLGLFALPAAPPGVRLLAWDGFAGLFLFVWMIGLMADLQRTDGLTPDKFLHLPVSPVGAFLINYASSLFSISIALFVPGMIGLILGQAIAEGPLVLLAFPLLAAFLLAVTALTYQFQSWLATLMTNPRRRRTVVGLVIVGFVLIFQAPNLINIFRPWENENFDPSPRHTERLQELNTAFSTGKLTLEEFQRQSAEANQKYQEDIKQTGQRAWEMVDRTARLANTVFPPGWLPLGAANLAGGSIVPALLGGFGLTLIGVFALNRAYRTTLRMYAGQDSGGAGPAGTTAAEKPAGPGKPRLVEWRLPWVSEPAAAVATAGLRSYLRAPEAKMALIVPVIMVVVYGSLLMSIPGSPPGSVRPLMAFGVSWFVLLCAGQLVGNQFGFDRGGFRAFVLAPIPRRDVLLGKNLAFAPALLGFIALGLVGVEITCPMRIDRFLAAFPQAVAMYLIVCLMGNLASILTPMPVAAGATKPTQVKLVPVLAQLAMLMALPIATAPLLLPIGLELLLEWATDIEPLPVALPLTIGLFALTVFIYRRVLDSLGRLLEEREQKVLEVVTSNAE
jgi:hypothetical protein